MGGGHRGLGGGDDFKDFDKDALFFAFDCFNLACFDFRFASFIARYDSSVSQ